MSSSNKLHTKNFENFQTMVKTPAQFQNDWYKTVRGVLFAHKVIIVCTLFETVLSWKGKNHLEIEAKQNKERKKKHMHIFRPQNHLDCFKLIGAQPYKDGWITCDFIVLFNSRSVIS